MKRFLRVTARVVQAAHRVCPAAVPCAIDRVCRAARSRAGRGNSRQEPDRFPAHRSAQEDGKAGHHLVDIDDKSLEKLGQWPWPRTRIAGTRTDPARRGRDRVRTRCLSEPDRLNPAFVAYIFQFRRGNPREACARCRATTRSLPTPSGLPRVVSCELPRKSPRSTLPVTGLAPCWAKSPQRFMFDFPNVPVLEHAAAGRGLFTIRPQRDGIIRRVPMIMQAQGQTMPSLTFERGGCRFGRS